MSARTKKKKKSRKRQRTDVMDIDNVNSNVIDQLKGLGFTQQQINNVMKDITTDDAAGQFDTALEILLANNASPPRKRQKILEITSDDDDNSHNTNNNNNNQPIEPIEPKKKTNLEIKEEEFNKRKEEMTKHETEYKQWEIQHLTLEKSLNEIRDNINNLYNKKPNIANNNNNMSKDELLTDRIKLLDIIEYYDNTIQKHLDFCNKQIDSQFMIREIKKQKLDNERFEFEQNINEFESQKYALQLMQNDVKQGINVMNLVERNLFIVASAINGNQENVDTKHFKQLNKKIKAIQNANTNNSNSKIENDLEEKNSKTEPIEFECGICFMGYTELSDILIFDECYHYYCMECLKHWLKNRLKDRNILTINCPFDSCLHILHHQEISYILTKEEFKKFDEYLLDKTLQSASDCRFCPGIDCGTAMFGFEDSPMLTCPKCKKQFCFNCGTEEWHQGVTCHAFKKWKEENGKADVKFDEWVKGQNAQQCPQCKSIIEKNGGCDHMTCQNCKYEFHWITGEKWKGYNHRYNVPRNNNNNNNNRRGRGGIRRARGRDVLQHMPMTNMLPLNGNNNMNGNNNNNNPFGWGNNWIGNGFNLGLDPNLQQTLQDMQQQMQQNMNLQQRLQNMQQQPQGQFRFQF